MTDMNPTRPSLRNIPVLARDEQFFYDNAGYSVAQGETQEQGHERSARELAAGERWLESNDDLYWEIHPDDDADESFMKDESEEYKSKWSGTAWFCQIFDMNDNVLASLGSCFGDEDYKRVVRAELALEIMKPEDFPDFVPAGDIPMATRAQVLQLPIMRIR